MGKRICLNLVSREVVLQFVFEGSSSSISSRGIDGLKGWKEMVSEVAASRHVRVSNFSEQYGCASLPSELGQIQRRKRF